MLKRKERQILEDIAREKVLTKEKYNLDGQEFYKILKKLSDQMYIQGVDFADAENGEREPVFLGLDVTCKGEDTLGFFK